MSYVESATRDALAKAGADTQDAQRTLILVAALLLLLHLLTVTPYVHVSSRLSALARDSTVIAQLSQKLDGQRAAIETAKKQASGELKRALDQATQEMIQAFNAVDGIVAGSPPALQSPMQARAPRVILPDGERLQAIIAAVRQNDTQAQKELEQYARENIVAPAYRNVNQTWNDQIRPAMISSIENAEKSVTEANALIPKQSELPKTDRSLAGMLSHTKSLLEKTRGEIDKMQLSPNDSVNRALGEEWWKSVGGKDGQANAVATQVEQQLRAVDLSAVVASFAQIVAMQEQTRTTLLEQQKSLEKDLEESQGDIAAIAGSSAVVPIHAKTLIGLFPLVLGLVLALMLFRIALCRGAAASAAADLAAVSTDENARAWLMRRAEADRLSSILEVGVLPAVVAIWIALAANQISAASEALKPALPVSVSALVGIIAVLLAGSFDYANIRRLSPAGRLQSRTEDENGL